MTDRHHLEGSLAHAERAMNSARQRGVAPLRLLKLLCRTWGEPETGVGTKSGGRRYGAHLNRRRGAKTSIEGDILPPALRVWPEACDAEQ